MFNIDNTLTLYLQITLIESRTVLSIDIMLQFFSHVFTNISLIFGIHFDFCHGER